MPASAYRASRHFLYPHSVVLTHRATIALDEPSRMVKRPTESGGEPSSSNCGASAGVKVRHLFSLLHSLVHPPLLVSQL